MKIAFKKLEEKGYKYSCEGNKLVIKREEQPIVDVIIFDRKIMLLTKEYVLFSDNKNLEISVRKGKYGYRIAMKTIKSKTMKILYKGKWYRYKNSGIPFFPELPYVTELLHM